ncbi:MAG: RHS repeat-associated core domain-containing protein [Phycisphaeraceae bacterium]|nr:RHS repeat-associated core domain-containing protein [Phycisphaeraceae bacterium]
MPIPETLNYNAAWQLLETRKKVGAGSSLLYEQFVWHPYYIDALAVRYRDASGDGTIDEVLYYLHDANMNVTGLLNESGAVVERYDYDAYGKVKVLNGAADADGGGVSDWSADANNKSDYDNPILYAGYRYDSETGLYCVRHRIYHPTLGRWLQRDPAGYVDGISLYLYGYSSPVNWVDPTGLKNERVVALEELAKCLGHGPPLGNSVYSECDTDLDWGSDEIAAAVNKAAQSYGQPINATSGNLRGGKANLAPGDADLLRSAPNLPPGGFKPADTRSASNAVEAGIPDTDLALKLYDDGTQAAVGHPTTWTGPHALDYLSAQLNRWGDFYGAPNQRNAQKYLGGPMLSSRCRDALNKELKNAGCPCVQCPQ